MTPPRPGQSGTKGQKSAEARSSAVEKVEKAEAQKGLGPGNGVGRRVHEGYRENA